MKTYIGIVQDYNSGEIQKEIAKSFEALKIKTKSIKTVFLKPNIVIPAKPDSCVITHPEITRAVIRFLKEKKIEKITIGEGVGVGQNAADAFCESGYKDLANEEGVELIDLDNSPRKKVKWKYGELMLPKIAFESDLYINLPKMKTHGQSMTTLSMKNQKGLLLPQDKKNFHVKWGLTKPLAELTKIVKPSLVIVDGIRGMEGEGPLNGKKKKSDVIVIGENQIAVDATCAKIMGINTKDVKHLTLAAEMCLGKLDPKIIGNQIDDVRCPYIPANQEFGNKLNVYSWRNPYACSMCIQSFSTAISMAIKNPKYWFTFLPKFAYYAMLSKLHLIQGKDAVVKRTDGRVLCMGACTKKLAEDGDYTHIEGCPPSPQKILEKL